VNAAAGIHCLPIPTPFAVGRVNTYLIEDSPLTLVDSGPNSGKALDELEQALAARDRRIEDIELLVLTHQHLDHTGLAAIIARRSGCEVAAIDQLALQLRDYRAEAEADDEYAGLAMRRHGIPGDVVDALRAVSAGFRGWGSNVEVTRSLSEGEEIVLRDRVLRVLRRPGHSPTDTVFWDAERRVLIAGDHLLKHISSNPLITRPRGVELGAGSADHGSRPQALVTYLESMRATREMSLDLVLGGHGDPIDDHVALIDERFSMHERRARKILRLVEEQPLSAYELAQALWGNVAVTQAYLCLSEVLGHVDVLLNAADVREVAGEDGVIRFART
jgi:glyoxylase-like metal-dependent hydrolase (beta-lactamase superfamily II)